MKHCTSCGKELKDQAKFCTRCGNKCSENFTEKPRLTQIQQELPEGKSLPHVEPPLQKEMTPVENAAPKEAGQEKTVPQGESEEKSEPVEQPSERKKTILKGKLILFGILGIALISTVALYLNSSKEKPEERHVVQETERHVAQEEEHHVALETAHTHRWEEATYNEPKTCKTCGKTEGAKKKPSSSLGLRGIISTSSASSVYSGDNLGRHGPEKMYDGKLDTNWTENVSGTGVGEYVTFYFDDIYAVKKINIYIGSHYNEVVYKQNCRPKVIKLTFSDGSTERITLEDSYSVQTITFDQYYYTDYAILTIEDVYTGTKYLDTVIAELDFVAYRP